MIRFLTAGESHGPGLTVIVEGLPAGLPVSGERIDHDLRRRQGGHGRGARMRIEADRVAIRSGVRHGVTLGSPVTFWIENRDWPRWETVMAVNPVTAPEEDLRRVHRPRPGHADLAGGLKYAREDLRDILERASARETAARTAAGALCRLLLGELGVEVASHVVRVGMVAIPDPSAVSWEQVAAIPADSPLGCADPGIERAMVAEVDRAQADGDSVNGAFQVIARGVPPGLGSHVHWDRKLDGRLMQAIGSIPAIKAVAIGAGVEGAALRGSAFHDEILRDDARGGLRRGTNRAGGIEGGITNGEEVRVTGFMKPLSTLRRGLRSVDLRTGQPEPAAFERTDTTAIRAAGIVGEAMVCYALADAMLEKLGGDSLPEVLENLEAYRRRLAARLGA
jgi:chorismate synthase